MYKISVVIPIYNVSKYLEETILSIVNQSIGIKNIELLLINDGSTDDSEKICLKYQELYKDNIKYIYKENSGVSETRNLGIEKSTGEYLLFLDGDDKLNKKSLEKLSKYLDKNKDINFVISRVRMFDKHSKWHYLDFRFKSHKKVVDINYDIDYCQYHSTGLLFRREILLDKKFDKNVKYGEDMKFMCQILLDNERFGIEPKSILYYRKRKDESSAVQHQFYDKSFYLNTLSDSFIYIFDMVRSKYNCIPDYYQYYILNSLVDRFSAEVSYKDVLNKTEQTKYIKYMTTLLNQISDKIILMEKRSRIDLKMYLLKFNRDNNSKLNVEYSNGNLFINNELCKYENRDLINIYFVTKDKNDIKFLCSYNSLVMKKIDIINNDIKIKVNKADKPSNCPVVNDIYGEDICNNNYFEFSVDKNSISKIMFMYNDEVINYDISGSVLKRNKFPKKVIRVNGKTILLKNDKIMITNYNYRIVKMYYNFVNLIYVLNRDGFIYTIKKIMGGKNE